MVLLHTHSRAGTLQYNYIFLIQYITAIYRNYHDIENSLATPAAYPAIFSCLLVN